MFINSLELHGYDRFTLANIATFKMDMSSNAQIIAGTNGSGKSSLLEQLSPLPPSSEDFPNGGKKIFRAMHKARQYEAVSIYGHPTQHFFYVDGKNINESLKETEQRALVKEHFGLTPAIFDLVTGRVNFSSMNRLKRQEWLMTLSGMDFDYIMRVFKNAKEKLKEYTALTKGYSQRETDEVRRLEGLRSPVEVEAELVEVETEVMHAVSNRSSSTDAKVQDHHIDSVLRLMHYDADEIFCYGDLRLPIEMADALDVADCDAYILSWQRELTDKQNALQDLYKRKTDLEMLVGSAATDKGIDDLFADIEANRLILGQLANEVSPFSIDDVKYLASSGEAIYESIGALVQLYPDNRTKMISKPALQKLKGEIDTDNATRNRLDRAIESLTHRISHLQQVPKVECPLCNHTFSPGTDPNDIASLQAELDATRKLALESDKVATGHMVQMDTFRNFQSLRTEITAIFKSSPRLDKLNEMFQETESQGCNAYMLREGPLKRFHMAVVAAGEYLSLESKLKDMVSAFEHAKKIQELSTRYEGQLCSDVDAGIEQVIKDGERLKRAISEGKVFSTAIKKIERHRVSLRDKQKDLDRLIEGRVKTIRGEVVDQYLSERQRELSALTEELSRATTIKQMIDRLSSFRKESEERRQAAKILVDTLSPVDGLIAECLNGFLNRFVDAINQCISEVWMYDFLVMPCITKNGDINYKFPVLFGNSTKPRPDIEATSAAQRDIINLVIRLIAMDLLGLEDFPLFIDEPPPTMDEMHRVKMITFIKNYLYSGRCSQMFMVSHYISNHGAFNNAEFCILDATNIVNMPAVFNKHVQMR